MLVALFVYVFCAASAAAFERCFAINSLAKRALLFLAVFAGQLLVAIQVLSLFTALTPANLLLSTGVLAAMIVAFSRNRAAAERIAWMQLARNRRDQFRAERKDFLTVAILVCAGVFFLVAAIASWMLFPYNDSYHFEMPRFWSQHRTLLPFPAANPRLVTLSFLSEALQLPGYMAHFERISVIATVASTVLTLLVIFSLARRIGASLSASACAAGISLGCVTFALSIQSTGAEMLLQGAFFGGSLIFLMDFATGRAGRPAVHLGLSIYVFLMSCGVKNSAMLLVPVYLIFLLIACWKNLQMAERTGLARRLVTTAILTGVAGLLFTGVAWNNLSNKIWFQPKGLPPVIRATLSKNFQPRDIWTRLCRGVVQTAADTLWVPGSLRPRYEAVCHLAVKVLGGRASLSEDDPSYSFKPAPMRGLGLVGILVIAPAFFIGLARSVSSLKTKALSPPSLNTVLLVVMVLAAFIVTHLVLRWQTIGLVRLMFPIVVLGCALAALFLENKIARILALGALAATALMFCVFWTGHVARRHGWTEKPVLSKIAQLQNAHSYTAKIQWKGEPPSKLFVREDYSLAEIHRAFLQKIKQPAVIGFISHENAECYSLFGEHVQNRIVHLLDARDDSKFLEASAEVDYVVADYRIDEVRAWAQSNGFEEIVAYSDGDKELFVGFARKSPSSTSARNGQQTLAKWRPADAGFQLVHHRENRAIERAHFLHFKFALF